MVIFDEGYSYIEKHSLNHEYPVEIWLGEVVFNRHFSLPCAYLLGGEEATRENLTKAKTVMNHIKSVLGDHYSFEDTVDLSYCHDFEKEEGEILEPLEPLEPLVIQLQDEGPNRSHKRQRSYE